MKQQKIYQECTPAIEIMEQQKDKILSNPCLISFFCNEIYKR
jgi:hypothetical protein